MAPFVMRRCHTDRYLQSRDQGSLVNHITVTVNNVRKCILSYIISVWLCLDAKTLAESSVFPIYSELQCPPQAEQNWPIFALCEHQKWATAISSSRMVRDTSRTSLPKSMTLTQRMKSASSLLPHYSAP
jgi:hypothetical protein